MVAFLVNRLAQALVVLLCVALLAFVLFNYIGDPINNMVGEEVTVKDREMLRERLGLNDPTFVQFGRFVGNAVRGNFGISYRFQRPVADILLERLPATLELVAMAALIAVFIAVPLGVYTGLHRDGWLSKLILGCSLISISLPTFLIGILLIYLFSVTLAWFPSFGRGPTVDLGWWSTGFLSVKGWKSIILPAITLSLYQLALILRLCRSEMLEVLRTDYIKFARARGLTNRAVHFGHALKNSLVPVITIIGLRLGALIAFSIVTETVFQWPGMGFLFIGAVEVADIPVMAAYLVLVGFLFVVINLFVDLLYYVIDPRLKPDRAAVFGTQG